MGAREGMPMPQQYKVHFFKEFSLSQDGRIILEGPLKTSKVFQLLQYFLAHRSRSFTKEHLIELLYGDEFVDNPTNALKIIVHRLRKQILTLGLPEMDYIINNNGKYGWNPEVPCQVDIEVFEQTMKKALHPGLPEEESLKLMLEAIHLYRGPFLGSSLSESWMIPLRVRYEEAYKHLMSRAFELIRKKEDYILLLYIASQGLELYPMDEDFSREKIYGLHQTGKTKEAIAEYNRIVDLIFNEYGVTPSEELQELYKKVSASTQKNAHNVDEVKHSLDEGEDEDGAYFTNYQNFADSYRFLVRGLERSGLSAYLMLCSMVTRQGKLLDEEAQLAPASDALKAASKASLRRGDLYTRYSPSQYLYLLIGINQENCSIVFDRIEKHFRKENRGNQVSLKYKVISAADIKKLFNDKVDHQNTK
jgi:DNA-binding SARP family transcriptional activator